MQIKLLTGSVLQISNHVWHQWFKTVTIYGWVLNKTKALGEYPKRTKKLWLTPMMHDWHHHRTIETCFGYSEKRLSLMKITAQWIASNVTLKTFTIVGIVTVSANQIATLNSQKTLRSGLLTDRTVLRRKPACLFRKRIFWLRNFKQVVVRKRDKVLLMFFTGEPISNGRLQTQTNTLTCFSAKKRERHLAANSEN